MHNYIDIEVIDDGANVVVAFEMLSDLSES